MRILVVGSGAREHSILRSLEKEGVNELFVVGGNPGIFELAEQVEGVKETDGLAISKCVNELEIELVIIGPEAPLAEGVTNSISENCPKTKVFGPSKEAAKLESSKSFAKEVMNSAGVLTAAAKRADNMQELVRILNSQNNDYPYVVKADGLMAGKGVIVTSKKSEAEAHASEVFHSGGFVIVEEYLDGPEFSQFFVCDGSTALPLQPAQDFKRIFDKDLGLNTGGMGAYTPLDWLPKNELEKTTDEVAQKVLDEMNKRGTPFIGILFAGFAYSKTANDTNRKVRVIEFNVRFGDPETQVVLESLKTPLSQILYNAANGENSKTKELKWSDEYFCNVVLAAKGYPESVQKGDLINGINSAVAKGAVVLQAGVKYADSDVSSLLTNGGRVLSVVQKGKTLKEARERAYNCAKLISFDGMQFRNDIAKKAVEGKII